MAPEACKRGRARVERGVAQCPSAESVRPACFSLPSGVAVGLVLQLGMSRHLWLCVFVRISFRETLAIRDIGKDGNQQRDQHIHKFPSHIHSTLVKECGLLLCSLPLSLNSEGGNLNAQ